MNKKVVKEIKEICKIYDVGKKVNQYFKAFLSGPYQSLSNRYLSNKVFLSNSYILEIRASVHLNLVIS